MKHRYILFALLVLIACDDDYLDKKPNKALVVPTTLQDVDAILNNTGIMNVAPAIGILGSDDFFTTDQAWLAYPTSIEKFGYVWASDIYQGATTCSDWVSPYQQIFYSNVALDALSSIPMTPTNETTWKTVRGRALFHRAFALYNLALLFCQPYSGDNARGPGLPIRLTSDVTMLVGRSSVEETYAQILADGLEASSILPDIMPSKTQPSKATANALLAIVNLSMQRYAQAETFASACLALNGSLIDYNVLNPTSSRPIARFNDEILFHSTAITYRFSTSSLTYIDTVLYSNYGSDDLRQQIFFKMAGTNRYNFKGNYTGTTGLFAGISIDEIYLVRAESRARTGDIAGAQEDLNTLLVNRYKSGSFVPVEENDPQALLALILDERRKELVLRPSRWSDLRRLNQAPVLQKTLQRKINGELYTLPPNDKRYVHAIPPQELTYNNMEQNPR